MSPQAGSKPGRSTIKRAKGIALAVACGGTALFDGAVLASFVLPAPWQLPICSVSGSGAPAVPVRAANLVQQPEPEAPCSNARKIWRPAATIDGVQIGASKLCEPDNPYLVAAVVKGTNNVSSDTLMQSGLSRDTVIKGANGDPNNVEIHLEVAELNGFNPSGGPPTPDYEIAPGIKPGLWAFIPKHRGMSTATPESSDAGPLLRLPAPTIRVRVGDHVRLVLENTHYLPHTIHMHGVDHPFLTSDGAGNDGVPMFNEGGVQPGTSKVYEATPRRAGTFFYHCHVEEQAHVPMGLAGLFIVEERAGDEPVQTLNIGAGEVRYRSAANRKAGYAGEYDLVYSDVLRGLDDLIRVSNDPKLIEQGIASGFNATNASPEYFLLNGRSFPYTLRDSTIPVEPNQKIALHVLNAGSDYVALHAHGHKLLVTHEDGMAVPEAARSMRDVVAIVPGQREDFDLESTSDGLHSDGPGLWMMHDHRIKAVTTNGMGHGGSMTVIAYPGFLDENGMPKTSPRELAEMFMPNHNPADMARYGGKPRLAQVIRAGSQQPPWTMVFGISAMPVLLAGMVFGIRESRPKA